MNGVRPRGLLVAAGACLAASSVVAQDRPGEGASEFSLSIGYAHVSLTDSKVIDGESALRYEPALTFCPIEPLPQLRVGVDVGVTLVLDNSQRAIISNNGNFIFVGSSDVPLWLIEPELRVSWRQYIGNTFFVEPGVAGGVAFGFFELESEDGSGDSYDKSDSTLYGRAFLRAGALVTGGTAGFEASWTSGGKLDFGGDAAGDLNEFYIGFFGALYF